MAVFIVLYISLAVVFVVSNLFSDVKKRRIFQSVVCFLLLWLIQGLRHESVGIDSCNVYRPIYDSIDLTYQSVFSLPDYALNFEAGFWIFCNVLKHLGLSTQMFVLAASFVSIAPISYVFHKYSPNIVFSYIIFASFNVYYFGFSGMRQAMAIGIVALSFLCIVDRKPLRFMALIMLACVFHTSAIVFAVAYPIYHYLNLSFAKFLLFLGVFLMGSIVLKQLVIWMVELIFSEGLYESYLNTDVAPSYNLIIILAGLTMSSYLVNLRDFSHLRNILFASICAQCLGLFSSSASRVAYYYYLFLALLLPLTAHYISNKAVKTVYVWAVSAFAIFLFFYSNANGYLEVIPYKFFWEE